ncbi:MAG: TonB-dependent receptor [Chitinophagaceae bacterium]|nr:TonB-dependent receptor [Chitinophagaceae bacterium]MBK8952997.1 TonB-dependent receptor [Chitinophagaceae bacterium]
MNLKYILLSLLLALSTLLQAQQTIEIKDISTGKPVLNATVEVDKIATTTNSEGKFTLTSVKLKLIITHISYETYTLTSSETEDALKKGVIYLYPVSAVMLNPVTIYSVKGKSADQKIKLENGDWVQHDAGQIINQIPGFSVIRKSGAFGFDPVFRGLKNEQLNIVTDGALTAAAACPNRMDPSVSQVLASQIDQIEVMKGPHSFRYGPAMGAVINFKSPEPEFSEKQKVAGRVNAGYESNGEVYRTEGLVAFQTKKVQLSAIGSYSKGHDYKDGRDSVMPSDFSRASAGITAGFKINAANIVQLSATRNFARTTDFPTLPMDLLSDDTWMIQAQYRKKAEHKWYSQWHTQVYTSFVDHKMGNKYRSASVNTLAGTDATTSTAGGRSELTLTRRKALIFAGADLKIEKKEGDRIRQVKTGPMAGKTFIDSVWQNSSVFNSGFFGEWHQLLKQYKLSVSGRLDFVTGNADAPSSKFSKQYPDPNNSDINFSISAGISRQWNKNWQTGLWLGRGTRSASISERYINSLPIGTDPYEMLGNPQLKPETNNQADLSVVFKSRKTQIHFNGFAAVISDYITSFINPAIAPRFGAPGVRQYTNTDKATLYGFEFNWQQEWIPAISHQFTFAYTHGKNNDLDKPLPEISPADARFRIESKLWKEKISLYLTYRYSFKQDRIADDYGEKITSSFSTLDLGIRTQLLKNLQFSLAVNNLFNKAYREHLNRYINSTTPLNAAGRSLIAMFSYKF